MVARVWRRKTRESFLVEFPVLRKLSLSYNPRTGNRELVLQFSPPKRSRRAHSGLKFLSQRTRVQQVEEALHLVGESFTVAEPPDFFHARHQVAIEILHAHHFFQAQRPCVRPRPLDFTPPCGASLMLKHDTASFTITVPASILRTSRSPPPRSRLQTL